ncbi:MAG: heme exporter protein CcmB [Flavobacteriales bacterium]
MWKEIRELIRMEFALEMRQKHALGSMLLYVVATVFICFIAFNRTIDLNTWNALFWVIMVFSAFNSVGRSFRHEHEGERLHRYLIAHPLSNILAKTLYNIVLMVFLGCLSLLVHSFFLGTNVYANADPLMIGTALILGSSGLASIITMIAAIASKSGNNLGITAILGFPVILPLLAVAVRFSKAGLEGLAWSATSDRALILLMVQGLAWGLSAILFPYLWRD